MSGIGLPAFRSLTEIFCSQLYQSWKFNIPNRNNNNLFRAVISSDEFQKILPGKPFQTFDSSKDILSQGMSCKDKVLEIVKDLVGRIILVRPDLIHHHLFLFR